MMIQHNIMALNSYNRLSNNNTIVGKNLEKLSSGYKINRAGDDAAGLAISEKMRAQITGLTRATQNSQDGISLVQTAEGQLTEVHSMLNRMVDLATQSSNGTIDNATDRANLEKEVVSLKDEINRISGNSHFNGIKLLDGTLGEITSTAGTTAGAMENLVITGGNASKFGFTLDIKVTAATNQTAATISVLGGAAASATAANTGITWKMTSTGNDKSGTITWEAVIDENTATAAMKEAYAGMKITAKHGTLAAGSASAATVAVGAVGGGLKLQIGDTAAQTVTVKVGKMDTNTLNLDGVSVALQDDATKSIDLIKTAINTVSSTRADLGAIQNRLEYTINNLTTTTENMTAAESRIRDTDMAKEMMAFTKNNVLSQAAQAMLAQANQQPQQVLQLLR